MLFLFPPIAILFSLLSMAPTIFAEKNFSRILTDVNGCVTVFIDCIRERHLCGLVYDNVDSDAFYCPYLVTQFYANIDASSINHDLHQFIVHFDSGDLAVNINTIEEITNPLPFTACCTFATH